MIQRIQSFYLVLAAVCIVLLFMFPIAIYSGADMTSELNLIPKESVTSPDGLTTTFLGQEGFIHTWPLMVIAILTGAITLVSIFLYKNRVHQMRWVALAFLLCVLYIFLVFFWATEAYTKHIAYLFSVAPEVSYSVGTWTPIVAAVLLFLAQRAIRKDEMKVRAADRLR